MLLVILLLLPTGSSVTIGKIDNFIIVGIMNSSLARVSLEQCLYIATSTASSMISTTSSSTTETSSTTSETSSPTLTTQSLGRITQAGDTIVGLYNTTAGGSTGGKNGLYSGPSETPIYAIDGSTSTKYFNYGVTGGSNTTANAPGIGTGFYITPSISNASIAVGLLFATANDRPNRDPLSVSLEGTNSDACDSGSSWTLLYNGSTGINVTSEPDRMTYGIQQNFSNTTPYKSYRLLITSKRGPDDAVQYSEAHIIGYT
ncbi:unnamed protein product [Adineta ricciae]|uniref:Uncharacterized protein n=1 Tax=Adineta ricciae TaxID=249248 RepID=A0A814TV96_ADIRI|nr:unnamed protein product [Adineta ricciae]